MEGFRFHSLSVTVYFHLTLKFPLYTCLIYFPCLSEGRDITIKYFIQRKWLFQFKGKNSALNDMMSLKNLFKKLIYLWNHSYEGGVLGGV